MNQPHIWKLAIDVHLHFVILSACITIFRDQPTQSRLSVTLLYPRANDQLGFQIPHIALLSSHTVLNHNHKSALTQRKDTKFVLNYVTG
jgi:hypothetical protein